MNAEAHFFSVKELGRSTPWSHHLLLPGTPREAAAEN